MHPEQPAEQVRVDKVEQVIAERLTTAELAHAKAKAELSSVERNYVQNARINTLEVDDRMETNAEVQQQKQLVAKNVADEEILNRQLTTLKQLKKSPYFGRIDILETGESQTETLYIGTASLVDDHQNFLIYDWRAPISSIYYNGTLGQVEYETPGGIQSAELKKKRQFTIVNGQITNMFDTNETVGDEILQSVLGQQSDEYMRNIVATIQREQNDIIRDTEHDLLLVQGVAGSGKTSAILQRIAFLLYHSRTSLAADQIILFSPNRLFSHYISEVLPSLGERNMRQLTLAEFLSQRFQGLQVESLFERYERKESLSLGNQALQAKKEAATFMNELEKYVNALTSSKLCFTDILLDGHVFFSKEEIYETFASLPAAMKITHRFLETKNLLIKRLKHRIIQEAQSEAVLEQVDSLSDAKYRKYLGTKRRGAFQEVAAEVEYIAKQIVKERFAVIYDAIYNNHLIDIYEQYAAFLTTHLPEAAATFNQNLEYHRLALEDAAPLLYLRDLITGEGQNNTIAHLFIDEVQDYSSAQLIYLKHVFPKANLTLLGDGEQALFNPLMQAQTMLTKLATSLDAKKPRLIALNKSYRSTSEITNFMKALLPDGDKIIAFSRPGPKPKLIFTQNATESLASLKKELTLRLTDSKQVALITKNLAESKYLYEQLHRDFNTHLLTDGDRALPSGLIILPIYLAKGLEFDNVISYDVSATNYPDEKSIGILYTICSRAMHNLTLITNGPIAPILKKVAPHLYTSQHTFKLS